ncbi:hypothetical protein BsWGS_24005 [Bradybaena similaris]
MGAIPSVAERNNLDTIPKLIQFWSQTLPDKELFVFYNGDRREAFTCRQVFQLAAKFSGRLRNQYGFQKGDIIINSLPNSPERVFIDIGIALAGCVSLSGSAMFSDGSDYLTAAHNSGLLAAIVCPNDNNPEWRILKQYIQGDASSATAVLACDKAPLMRTAILVSRQPTGCRGHFLQELRESTEELFVDAAVLPDDMMIVMTTSGSTGYCKMVPKTHRELIDGCLVAYAQINKQSRQQWQHNIVYNDRSIGWIAGFPHGTYVFADTRVMLDVFDSQGSKVGADTWAIICREKVDYAIILPLDLDHLLKHTSFDGTADYKMKLVCSGGQPIRKNQVLSYMAVAREVATVYGCTEVGFVISIGIVDENNVKDHFCGQVRPGLEVRVVDDNNKECPSGTVGTIHVKGRGVFKGYLNRVENPDPKTLTAFTKDGYLNMDDSGYFDEDRNLHVLGRIKDVITLGGTFVYPGWLEPKIAQHPAVTEACVVPVSDPVLFQNVCAIVKLVPGGQLGVEELREFCHRLFVADGDVEDSCVPKFYLILQDFPETGTGKIDRKRLQKLAEDKFGSR